MKQSLLLFTTIFLTICVLNIECGIVQIGASDSKQKTDAITSPVLSQWMGKYNGTLKKGFGNSPKTSDSPAEIIISQFAGKISFVLKRSYVSPEWHSSYFFPGGFFGFFLPV